MGQDSSAGVLDDKVKPETLTARNISAVASLISSGKAKKIVVLTGAGISTSAGIPDFRSPETGLYANLARLNLPYPEAVFDIDFFEEHPEPFYALARELYPGKFAPTIAHAFIALLAKKGLLRMLFTQNIDCLERMAGVPDSKVIEAHGSFATQRCISCSTEYPDDQMKEMVMSGDVPHCITPQCNGLVKPDIVFFGEQLPHKFFMNSHVPGQADLMIILGTSLTVQPFASLPEAAADGVPRLLFNLERVGTLGTRRDDVCVLEDCDTGVRKLANELGWTKELEKLWESVGGKPTAQSSTDEELAEVTEPLSKDEELEAEIEKLTGEVDAGLKLSAAHTDKVKDELEAKQEAKQEASLDKVEGEPAVSDKDDQIASSAPKETESTDSKADDSESTSQVTQPSNTVATEALKDAEDPKPTPQL